MAATKQDILMFKKQLSKEDNTPVRILDILEQVGTLKITLDLLKGTKIGKKIGLLRNSKNEKIAAAAKTIVSNWKKIASAATTNKKIEKDNNNNNNGNETNNNNNNTVATKETIASSTTTTTTTTTDGEVVVKVMIMTKYLMHQRQMMELKLKISLLLVTRMNIKLIQCV